MLAQSWRFRGAAALAWTGTAWAQAGRPSDADIFGGAQPGARPAGARAAGARAAGAREPPPAAPPATADPGREHARVGAAARRGGGE